MRKLLALCLLLASFATPPVVAQPATGTVEAWFSPWDDVESKLIGEISSARNSLHVQAYLLTSRNIAKALLQAHLRGVRVLILADGDMVSNGENSQIPKLAEAGIPVWLETRYANAHNKIMLVDAETSTPVVVTGSYNYTWSAQARNAENILILRDHPAVTAQYLKNWRRHQRDAESYTPDQARPSLREK